MENKTTLEIFQALLKRLKEACNEAEDISHEANIYNSIELTCEAQAKFLKGCPKNKEY